MSGRGFRSCGPDILDQHKSIKKEIAAELLNSVPNPAFILNSDRRIILYNDTLSAAAGERRTNKILGRRPGEIFRCCNSQDSKCGEAVPCVQCGALRAIQTAMTGEKAEEICMLLSNVDGKIKAYTFKVNASPLTISEKQYFIIHLTIFQTASIKK